MSCHLTVRRIDAAIRFLLYTLLFWLPYSKAVIEICVVGSALLWVAKRIFIWFCTKNIRESFRPVSSPLDHPISIFLGIGMMSILGSATPGLSYMGFINKTLEWFVIYFLVLEVIREKKHVVILMVIFAVAAMAVGVDCLVQLYVTHKDIFNGRALVDGYRVTASFSHPNCLGGFLAFAIPFIFSLFFIRLPTPWFYGGVSIILGTLLWSLLLTYSRGAWMAVALGILWFMKIFFQRRRNFFPHANIILALLALVFLVLNNYGFMARKSLDQSASVTADWRLALWHESLGLIKERPFLGHGLNTFMPLMKNHLEETQSPLGRGFSPSYAHNCFLQIAVETGVLGLSAFVWLTCGLFRRGLEGAMIELPGEESRQVLLKGLLAGVFAFMVHSFFDTHFYSLQLSALMWFMIGTIMALARIVQTPEPLPSGRERTFLFQCKV